MGLNPAILTTRDQELVEALTHRVRVMSLELVGNVFFSGATNPKAAARRRLTKLAADGWTELFTMPARPELRFDIPIICWSPGHPPPVFSAVAYQGASRWQGFATSTHMVIATEAAANWSGGSGGRRPRLSETSHDLSLAALYFEKFRSTDCTWIPEAGLLQMGYGDHCRLPDAMIRRDSTVCFVELVGEYSATKLRAFHDFASEVEASYELW